MRKVDFNNLTRKDLLDYDAIAEAFKNYLIDVLGYDEHEADIVIQCDFENPYNTPFIIQEYEGEYTVDGKAYSVRFCYTEFRMCGMFHLANEEPFEFYMFFELETLPDKTVGSYRNARKLYLI